MSGCIADFAKTRNELEQQEAGDLGLLRQEPTCLPAEFLSPKRLGVQSPRGGHMLLSCPPSTVPENAVRGAVRGQLIRRQPPPALAAQPENEACML